MKKAAASILLLIYFTVSTGFVISSHYCMDRFDSVQLGASDDETCGRCGMHKEENKCCRDEVMVVKIENSHLATQVNYPDFSLPAIIPHQDNHLLTSEIHISFSTFRSNDPPPGERHIYLLHRVFRI